MLPSAHLAECRHFEFESWRLQLRLAVVVGTMFGGIESNRALLLSLLSCALAQASKVVTHWYDAPDVRCHSPAVRPPGDIACIPPV